MKARFDFTINDLVDAGERSLSRSSVIRGLRRTAVIIWAAAGGALAFALVPASLPVRLTAAAGAALGGALAYPAVRKKAVRDRLHAYWKERLSSEGPFACEVELTDEGVGVRQFDGLTLLPWSAVKSIADAPDAVEITSTKGSLIVVRARAFSSAQERADFLHFGREHLAGASSSAASLPDRS